MQEKIRNSIETALRNLGIASADFTIGHPEDSKNGDFSTNVAMVAAKISKINPRDLAEKIAEELRSDLKNSPRSDLLKISKVESAKGFINFYLSPEFFAEKTEEILKNEYFGKNKNLAGQKIMVEHTDPNPFKEFHVGHLMPNVIGSTIARVLEWNGAEVRQACYQGDVGLHVAKAVWALKGGADIKEAYAKGSKEFEENEESKKEIEEINKKIYAKSDKDINEIYRKGRTASLDYFDSVYKKLGTRFDFFFFESGVAGFGKEIVEKNVGQVFEKGEEGAIIFRGEKFDPTLHTRVFVNKEGLPTYEAKELGLAQVKYEKYKYDQSVIITGNEINEYFRVLICAMVQVFPKLARKTLHLSHGMLRLPSGKMSSRTGEVITAESLIEEVKKKVKDNESVAIASIKYMILRQAIGGDIIFDIEKSVSTEGDSGVYLQYSYARARSVLEKAKSEGIKPSADLPSGWQTIELEKLLYRFPEVVELCAAEFAPHYLAKYLTDLARAYNSFYGREQIVKHNDPSSPYKVALSQALARVMRNGLSILGIHAPERM